MFAGDENELRCDAVQVNKRGKRTMVTYGPSGDTNRTFRTLNLRTKSMRRTGLWLNGLNYLKMYLLTDSWDVTHAQTTSGEAEIV